MESQVTVHLKGSRRNVLFLNKAPSLKSSKDELSSIGQNIKPDNHRSNTGKRSFHRNDHGNRVGRGQEFKHTLFDCDERELQRREFANREGSDNLGNFNNGFDYLNSSAFSEQDERALQIASYAPAMELNGDDADGNTLAQSHKSREEAPRYSGACQVHSGKTEGRKQRCAGLYGINRSRQRRESGNVNFKPRVQHFTRQDFTGEKTVSEIKECKLSDMAFDGSFGNVDFTEAFDLSDLAM